MTTDTFIQPPVTTNTPREKKYVANERQIPSDSLTETLKVFNKLTLQSTINDSTDDHSNKNVTESDPKSNQLVATHTSNRKKRKTADTDTTKGNYPHKLLTNRENPAIVPFVILLVNQTTADGVAKGGRALHAVCAVLHKVIITAATRSAAGVLKDPPMVNWKYASGQIPQDRNTVRIFLRSTTPVWTGTGPSVPPIIIGSQQIEGKSRPIIPQEVTDSKPLDASINRIPTKHKYPTPSWSKVIGSKIANESIYDVYALCWMTLASDTALSKNPNFMDSGLSPVEATDERGSIFASTNRIVLATHGSVWIQSIHCISEDTADRVSGMKTKKHYNFKCEFESMRDQGVDQYFGRPNDPMSRPPFDSTPLGINTINGTTSPSDSIPVEATSPNPTPLTLPMYLPALPTDLPGVTDPDPSLSDSSNKYNSSNDTNSSKSKKKKRDKKKKRQKDKKDHSSDPSSSDDSDSSYDSYYRRKRC